MTTTKMKFSVYYNMKIVIWWEGINRWWARGIKIWWEEGFFQVGERVDTFLAGVGGGTLPILPVGKTMGIYNSL